VYVAGVCVKRGDTFIGDVAAAAAPSADKAVALATNGAH
jgi:hypothetical protein